MSEKGYVVPRLNVSTCIDEICPDGVSKPHLSPIHAIKAFENHKLGSESEKIFTSSTWKGLEAFPPHFRIKGGLFTARTASHIRLLNANVVQLSKTVIPLENKQVLL
ncbi:hypothetical protein O181_081335 [Austropuccinia psidii MF-1]|uniref:Uncharacterized protein n=1 Tax=Austropuccinia psidii MF-1 TaxID=1389203 RepID=A0A9Q3FIT7_9BASI|nr:hypothetical protein [Austropuccinia psidii MF-1]